MWPRLFSSTILGQAKRAYLYSERCRSPTTNAALVYCSSVSSAVEVIFQPVALAAILEPILFDFLFNFLVIFYFIFVFLFHVHIPSEKRTVGVFLSNPPFAT